MAEILINNVKKSYGKTEVIHGASFKINDGELVVIVGPSGCGKSTLLRMIAGLEKITEGDISINGKIVNNLEPSERNIAMVFQNYALYPHMSVYKNMEYGLKIQKIPKDEIKRRVNKAAKILEIEEYLERSPRELSGGQRQRVAMGRAIVRKPDVFLFDEPLSNLDAKLRTQTRLEIKRVQKMLGITAIYVTHDQEEALSMSDQVIVMNKGEIVQAGPPEEIYNRPNSIFVADFIGDANFIDVDVLEVKDKIIAVNLQNQTLEINKGNSYQDIKAGEKVYLSIKPEAVNVNQNGAKFSGNLYSTSFLGANTEYEIEFENIIISSVQKNSESDLKTLTYGSKVSIDFNVDYLQILRKE